MRPACLAVLACIAGAACKARVPTAPPPSLVDWPGPAVPADRAPAVRRDALPELAAPAGWADARREDFEAALERWNPAGQPARLAPEALADFSAGLLHDDDRAVRAALLLARSADPQAYETLLRRLEARTPRRADRFPAAEIVAAAALADVPAHLRAPAASRLERLARGDRPHPHLCVRVECAASALRLESRAVQPFLLEVLREGTRAQSPRPSWTRAEPTLEELEWAQTRAAQALSERAGVPCLYRAEASAQDRANEAASLEHLLRLPGKPGG